MEARGLVKIINNIIIVCTGMKVSSDQIVVSVFITPKTQTVIIIIPKEFLVLVAPRARFFYSGFWDLGSGILLPDSCSTDTGDGYSFLC